MDVALTRLSLADATPRRRAVASLGLALAFGVVTQALFWRTGIGVNLGVWTLLVLAAELALFARPSRRVPASACGAIAACALLASSIVVHASCWTLVIALPADLVLLAALPFLLRDAPTMTELAAVRSPRCGLWRGRRAPRPTPCAGSREALGGARSPWGLAKGLLLGVPAAGIFALLLSSDDDFREPPPCLPGPRPRARRARRRTRATSTRDSRSSSSRLGSRCAWCSRAIVSCGPAVTARWRRSRAAAPS
jgi:hypothetical protein